MSKSRPAPNQGADFSWGLGAPKIKATSLGGLFCGEDDLWRLTKDQIGPLVPDLILGVPGLRVREQMAPPRLSQDEIFWQCNCCPDRSLVCR